MKTQVMCRRERGTEGVRTYVTHSLPAEDDAATTVQATAVPVLNQSTKRGFFREPVTGLLGIPEHISL